MEGAWEIWYRDTFDRDCPPKLEVNGEGLVEGLTELWARYLLEGIDGFSQFRLSWKNETRGVEIRGDLRGARALRRWVFGNEDAAVRAYREAADARLLAIVAGAHARLFLAGRTSEPILQSALAAADCPEFERRLSALE